MTQAALRFGFYQILEKMEKILEKMEKILEKIFEEN